jgi:phage baseplate assembly protein gpV
MTTLFWAEVIQPSKDAGPYKGVRVQADGHEFNAMVLEPGGFHQSPMMGSQILVALPDGDMGKAVVIGGQAPKDRVDGQKEGMLTIKNHKTGAFTQMDADGNVNTETSGNVTIKCAKLIVTGDVEITGNITQTGDFNQSGVHTDSNGPHTA